MGGEMGRRDAARGSRGIDRWSEEAGRLRFGEREEVNTNNARERREREVLREESEGWKAGD